MAHFFKLYFCGMEVYAIGLVYFWSKFSNIVVRRILVEHSKGSSVFSCNVPTLFASGGIVSNIVIQDS